MTFTAHNVVLNDGTKTIPDGDSLLVNMPSYQAAVRSMKAVFGSKLDGVSVVDLGCLEGGYAAEFARLGMNATGIEARQTNIDNCEIIRRGVGLDNLKFHRDDVNNIDKYEDYDVAFCSGILYHLDNPRAFLEKMSSKTKKMIIIHTAYATYEQGVVPDLSELTENEGMAGRWYGEHPATEEADREQYKWSSWANNRSFWLTKAGIFDLLQNFGFGTVYEQMDWLGRDISGAMTKGYYAQNQRAMIVGVRV